MRATVSGSRPSNCGPTRTSRREYQQLQDEQYLEKDVLSQDICWTDQAALHLAVGSRRDQYLYISPSDWPDNDKRFDIMDNYEARGEAHAGRTSSALPCRKRPCA